MAVLDDVDRFRCQQGLQVDVLLPMARGIRLGVDAGRAVNDSLDGRAMPVAPTPEDCCSKRPDVEPPPTWLASTAEVSPAVVEVETVNVDANSHANHSSVPDSPAARSRGWSKTSALTN